MTSEAESFLRSLINVCTDTVIISFDHCDPFKTDTFHDQLEIVKKTLKEWTIDWCVNIRVFLTV